MTALCLDGNEGWCGGRPSAEFVDLGLPRAYKRTSRSRIIVTFITGSSAAGEAVPPYFQFPSKVESCNFKGSLRGVSGTFGCDEEIAFSSTCAVNEKGGMTDDEFKKYVMTNIT